MGDDRTEQQTIQASARLGGSANMTVRGYSIGTALSISHIHAAALFASESFAIETGQKPYADADVDRRVLDHRAHVMGAVFMSVAFLDAIINEECENHKDMLSRSPHWPRALQVASSQPRRRSTPPSSPEEALGRLMPLATLGRVQAFLVLSGQRPFDPAVTAYDRANSLCRLRNRLVHYEPIWEEFPSGTLRHHRDKNLEELQTRLQAEFPAINPLLPDATWLYRVLSHACAGWAVRTAIDLADTFYTVTGISRPYSWSDLHLNTQ